MTDDGRFLGALLGAGIVGVCGFKLWKGYYPWQKGPELRFVRPTVTRPTTVKRLGTARQREYAKILAKDETSPFFPLDTRHKVRYTETYNLRTQPLPKQPIYGLGRKPLAPSTSRRYTEFVEKRLRKV